MGFGQKPTKNSGAFGTRPHSANPVPPPRGGSGAKNQPVTPGMGFEHALSSGLANPFSTNFYPIFASPKKKGKKVSVQGTSNASLGDLICWPGDSCMLAGPPPWDLLRLQRRRLEFFSKFYWGDPWAGSAHPRGCWGEQKWTLSGGNGLKSDSWAGVQILPGTR